MSLRDRLRTLIDGWDLDLDGALRDDTSLIRSGLLDSVALFQLVLWLEEQIGATVNPAEHDLVEEWDTIDRIVRFVERFPADSG
jgi:acyl carrier protein